MMIPKNRAPTHPGQMLLHEFLEPLNLSQKEFAEHVGWTYPRLNEIINCRRGISPDSALILSEALSTTPEFWLDLQTKYDLWQAAQKRKNKPKIKKLLVTRKVS